MLAKMERAQTAESPEEAHQRLSFPRMAKLLEEAGYRTLKGHEHGWPAQVQQLLEGRLDSYYSQTGT